MTFRRVLFWSHLAVGTVAGLFVAFLAATGSILAFESQIVRFVERGLVPAQTLDAGPCLSAGALMGTVQAQIARPVGALQLFADRQMPTQIQFGKEDIIFVDPCHGQVLPGESALRVRAFLSTVRNLHESAALSHQRSGTMRELKNAANIGFVVLIPSGLILWMPRKWKKASIRAVTMVRMSLRGRAREWNLHNVGGLWFAIPLLAITLTGAIMSYTWAEGLLYRVSGSPALPSHDSTKREERGARGGGQHEHDEHRDGLARALTPAELVALDPLVERATRQLPGWRSLRLRITGRDSDIVSFTFNDDEGTETDGKMQRSALAMSRADGEILRWTPPGREPAGQRWRMYARVLHTGEAFGVTGQLIALTAALAALLLVWTGFALSIRRFLAWRSRSLRMIAKAIR
jgi:uncharacterized iron-regulated membrane protein